VTLKRKGKDSDTRDPSGDGLSATKVARVRRNTGPVSIAQLAKATAAESYYDAAVILIAHPENRKLGNRFTLTPGGSIEIGRAPSADISLPEVPSLSRSHARLVHKGDHVLVEDLGSRNGTFVNERQVRSTIELRTGDRFQVGSVHFKFLQERDVEHAYHEAIYQMVMRDGLTEVFNRRKFQEEGAREVARATRHERPLTLLMFDIDHFKVVNDTYGHLCGDSVLKQIAARVSDLVRPEQIFARVGGEEFAVLCPETDSDGAAKMAQRMRDVFAAKPFDCGAVTIVVTCSFGVAGVGAGTRGLEDLVAAADRALYRAKNLGRDRIEVEPPEAAGD
jgi:two-component system cell cycle response regulator